MGAKLLETRAVTAAGTPIFSGAMLNSGAMGGALPNYEFRADLRVVYQYNRDVERFDADPQALAAITADGQPTGVAPVPVISINSANDPQAAVEAQYEYRARVQATGSGQRLVRAYTDEPGHTAQSATELPAAFDALMQWIEKGVKPTPVTIAAACERLLATHTGPCPEQRA